MADRKTIQIPVDVQLKIKDQSKVMRGMSEEMQNIFANADPGTAFYKSLSKAIVAIEKKLNSADSLLGKEFFSEADLGKTTTLLGGVADILSEISTLAKRTSTVGLGFETDELIQANEALKALQATIRSTKKNTKVGAVSGMLDREEVKRMVASSKDTGFSAGKTFDENQAAMAKSLGKVTEEYVRFQQEAAAAAEIAEKAGQAVAASKVELNMAKGELQARKDLNTNLAKQIADIKVSGQGATKENIAKQYQDVLFKQLISVDGEKYAPIIAGWLDVSEAELTGTATEIARNLEKAINTAMAAGPAAKNKLRINAKSVLDGKAAALQKDRIYGETEQKVAIAAANVDTAEEAAKEAVSGLQAANNTVTQTSNLLATIQSQMIELKKLQAEYNALVDEQHANELIALRNRQQDANYNAREGERVFAEDVKKAQGSAQSGYNYVNQAEMDRRIREENERLANEAARESQEFTNNLKQSIAHWMSAQQVINMVKDGIRQAYQDIKGLDTAMTNIAVVTDMSISDLWGKINDYMSIAQQYGVTTQGVYEVSQLYYQQGLSTNEVMAATTETLKMARIAGMDYADAADAMTVAIRAFKMEMTDAAHVTDVYSKVAAVTASDSEELAIAMSKTASSAESVGSSFENTTAMLAVMIETTRESAQNLGSALKSIISRYGEMKVGLTVDSEGEDIDYNKVDTALKSIGISIKDAQGQFRDFDDVIFELSAKWDSLDKNTQRYIATIMAGNRQQSRFIALVDNWERLDEVANAAQDSEDAGLLQYAKTLDSLDTKLNNIKTSFQEFYMSIFNGPLIGKGLEFINNIIKGFNKLSKFTTILNIGSIISGIKLISTILINTFSSSFSQISVSWKQMLNELALSSRMGGQKAGKNYAAGAQEGKAVSKLSRKATIGVSALSLVGTGLSMAGSAVADKNQEAGTIMSSLGSGLQIGTMVGMINPIAGVITGALTAIISGIASWPSELEKAQQNLEKAKEAANKANIKRAETKQRVTDLESSIEQIRRLEKSRFESDEAEQAWIDANNALYEKFPELAATFQNGTDAIVDLESAEYLLIQAREKAAEAAKVAAKTAYEEAKSAREEEETQQAAFEAETVTKYGDENNTTSLTLGLKLAEHLQAERNKYKKEYGGSGAVYDSFAFNKVLTSKTQAFSRPYTQLLTSGIDLYNQDMLYWLFGHENLSEEEILNSFINNLEAGTLKFEEGTTADMAVEKFTNGAYKTVSDLIASRNSNRRDVENAQYIENQLDLNQAVVEASTLLDTSYYTEAWLKELEGSASLIEESVKQSYAKSGLSFEKFKSQVPTLVANLANSFSELYNNLYAMGNVDEFSSLIENLLSGQITEHDFKINAQQIFGFEDFDTFISNTEDPLAAALNLYYTDFITELQNKQTKIITALAKNPARQLNWDEKVITNLLQQVPDTYYNEIIAFANSIESKIGAGNLSETQATILIEQYAKIWENLANPDLKLDTEQLASARQMLSEADLFSITGIQELETGLLKLQINPDVVNSIMENIPIYTANLITEYAQLENKLATNLTNATDAMKKASQGMELDEALRMASQLGISIADFDFTDGKWFYKNIEAINDYYIDETNKLKIALESEAARITSLFSDNKYLNNKNTFKALMNATEDQQKLFTSEEKEIYTAFLPYYADFTKWQTEIGDSLDGKGIAAQWAEYFSSLGKEIDDATAKAMEYYNEQSQKEADKAVRLSQIAQQKKSIGINEDLIIAQQTLAATEGKVLTNDQRYEFEKGFGFKDIDFKIDAEGNWELTEEAIQKGLAQLNQSQKNIWVSQIENNSKSALESAEDLGSKLASGEAGTQDYMDVFGNQIQYEGFGSALAEMLASGLNKEAIKDRLRKSGNYQNEDEINEAYNKLVASYQDGIRDNITKQSDLTIKKLKGTATNTELNELDAITQKNGSKIAETWTEYIKQIAENSSMTVEERLSALTEGYTERLNEIIKEATGGKIAEQINTISKINTSKGEYDTTNLASIFASATEAGFNEEELTGLFDYSEEANAFTLNMANLAALEANKTLDNIQKAYIDAFKKAEHARQVANLVERDEKFANFESELTDILNDYTSTSLEQIIQLHETVFGENSVTTDQAQKYNAAVQAARNGQVEALAEYINTIANAVITSGQANVDFAVLVAALEDGEQALKQSLIDRINAAIEGPISAMDMVSLGQDLDIDNIQNYFVRTFEGYEATQEGMMILGTKMVEQFGSAYEVAKAMYDLFVGEDKLFNGYKELEDSATRLRDEAKNLESTDADRAKILREQADLLDHMAAVSRGMANDATFDFMNQDHFDGAADNWYTFTNNMSTAIDKLKSAFEKGGKIDYKSFDNIVTWIADLSVDGLDTKLGETGITLGKFTDAVLATVDATGKLDLSAAAVNLGISMDDMAGALEGGLQEVAKQQVAYWKKYLDFLKGLKKLQDAQAEVQLEIPIKNETTGKWTYKGNTYDSWEALAAVYEGDVAAAQQYFENFSYTGANGTTITLSGENNPLNFILGKIGAFDSEGNLDLKEGMAAQIGQYMAQVYAWIDTLTADDIKKYVNKDTGEITIPWDEVLQIELDTSTTPEVSTSGNSGETGAQTEGAINNAAEQALTDSGLTPAGDGSYTYTLDGMTLKIQMGANGSVEIDLTNATGILPSAAELRKVFEGQEGFTATDDNNWVFTDSNLGFSIKCSNGTLSFDTSGMTAPAAPTAAELSAILGTTWNTTDGGKTYTTNLNGVSFVYNSTTGKININASSFQLTGGLDAASLATILGGTWITEDNGATYTATIAGTSFVYESSSGLVKIDGSKFTLSGGLSATELATILGGAWSSPDGGTTYESTINGVTFTYKSASGTVEIDSSKFTLSAGLSATQLNSILGGDWKSSEDGTTYTSVIGGVTFTYKSDTGTVEVDPTGFTVSANLTPEQLKTLLGSNWTSEDEGKTYTSTINGVTFTYESSSGALTVKAPTTVDEPSITDLDALMTAQGWNGENGVYTKEFASGTLTYNATAGTLSIKPSATMDVDDPDMATLLDSAFGVGGWEPNTETGGYNILNATTGEVLYTLPAKVTITPTAGSNVTLGENGLTTSVDVELTPHTGAIDDALAIYEGKTINLNIGFDKGSSIRLSQNFQDTAKALFGTTEWDTLLNVKNWSFLDGSNQDQAQEAYGALVTEASALSRANQLTQEDLDLLVSLGESLGEAGVNVSRAIESLSSLTATKDTTVFTELTAFAEAFGGANLFGNLTALINLLTTISNPELATLDLTNFISQIEFMGELELDDEEINLVAAAAQALADALLPLKGASINPTVSVDTMIAQTNLDNLKKVYDAIKSKTVTVTVETEYNNGNNGGDGEGEEGSQKGPGVYAGNVSGLALAKGNATDKLLAGAHLAGKTLVGELGPELAVYDNQYHLLGRNGAEFVDLPNDAIIFNHRQTAGIIKGQAGYRGQALANGNVTGPAAASGIDASISAVEKIIKLWSNIADSSLSDLLSSGGGGGGGGENSVKAVTEELVKWYNLSRQIEKLEQDINNILAERENIIDGGEYLRSLREQQKLLAQQATTQQTLLAYQEEQLERQKQHILNNKIWSQFLTFDESGNLQYIIGNESDGGQGQLNVLEQLNKMSGEEQLDYIKNTLGYSYTDQDGNKLDGEDLITKFFEEFQSQIDSYDALFDTVNSTEEKLQEIQSTINEIDQEIEQNQMDLEQAIYDIIVDAWEKQIEQMEEQMELVQEANEAYIENLNKALANERDMYSQNELIADRESLQNRLALLRRSGGSASEIYDLEQQLDDMLKDEYFNKQEEMIQNIEEASKEQIKKLEEQIKLEEEALEYQKENGVLWTQVYEIMRGTEESILAFMQGNSPEFFSQSALQQKQMLTDWAKQIGIYTEDQQYKNYQKEAEDTRWNNGSWRASASEGGVGQELATVFDGLGADQQDTLQSLFTSTYANKMLETGNENAASAAAIAALQAQLRNIKSQQASAASSGDGDSDSNNQPPQQEKRYVYMRGTYNEDIPDGKGGFTFRKGDAARVGINTDSIDKDFIRQKIRNAAHGRKVTITSDILYGFSEGGLVDYTGPAIVHGSPSKPEAFLNAKQTAMISEAVRAIGDGGALNGIKATLAALNSTIKSIVNNDNSLTSSFTVAPGAITIQVAQLSDSYDVEELSKDVMNRMVAIAARATNRGVNRR